MNESFGELSRPMRNRGIEIYLNDFDLNNDLEDIFIILNTLYPFNNNKSDMEILFNKIIEANIKHIHFSDILKMFKLTYDYWLFNNNRKNASDGNSANSVILQSFGKMLDDLKVKYEGKQEVSESNNSLISRISERNYHSEILKLREYKIYRFLFNFPLYSQFLNSTNDLFAFYFNENDANVGNYSKSFLKIVKKTQFIDLWLKNIPIGYLSLIFKFTRSNLQQNKSNSIYRERMSKLFELITKHLFNSGNNMLYKNFTLNLNELAKTSNLDLSEESLNIKANSYLLKKFDTNQAAYESMLNHSHLLHVIIRFYLSKFRIESFYATENNQSLASIIEKIDSNIMLNSTNDASNSQVVSLKFLKQLKPFYESFFTSLINYFYFNSKQFESFDQEILMRTVYLIEKFYLLCSACSYDSVLTLSFMKYYWSFIENGLKEIEKSLPK
jgi:hypothetical protein